MDGIKGNEVILDTLLSTNDMANYEKNFNEMSSLYKLPIISALLSASFKIFTYYIFSFSIHSNSTFINPDSPIAYLFNRS